MALLLPMVIAAFAYWRTTHFGVAFAVWGVATLVGLGLAWGVQRHNAQDAVAREQAWLSALPFEVQGWFDALEREPEAGRLKVTLSFANEAPDTNTVHGLAAVVDATLTPGLEQVLTSHDIEVQGDDDDTPNNAGYLRWQRKLLMHVLTPLHQAYPLKRVRFQRA